MLSSVTDFNRHERTKAQTEGNCPKLARIRTWRPPKAARLVRCRDRPEVSSRNPKVDRDTKPTTALEECYLGAVVDPLLSCLARSAKTISVGGGGGGGAGGAPFPVPRTIPAHPPAHDTALSGTASAAWSLATPTDSPSSRNSRDVEECLIAVTFAPSRTLCRAA